MVDKLFILVNDVLHIIHLNPICSGECSRCHLEKFILGLFKLQELVKAPDAAKTEMYIRQAGPTSYRQVLREVRQKEIYKLIVDTNPKHIHHFFRAVSAFCCFISLLLHLHLKWGRIIIYT